MIASADSWIHEPIVDERPIPYRAHFSQLEFERLKIGVVPRSMDEKWFVFFEKPTLHIHRSSTGLGVYRIDFTDDDGGVFVESAFCAAQSAGLTDGSMQAGQLGFLISSILTRNARAFVEPVTPVSPAAPRDSW